MSAVKNTQLPWQENCWGEQGTGPAALSKKLNASSGATRELVDYFCARSKLEADYAAGLANLNKTFSLKTEAGVTISAFATKLSNATELISRAHQQLSGKLETDLAQQLEGLIEVIAKAQKVFEAEIMVLQKAAVKDAATLDKCRKDYLTKCQVLTRAIDVASKGQTDNMTKREYERIQQHVIKSKKEVDSVETDYKVSVDKFNNTQDELERKVEAHVVAFQKIEIDRLKTSQNMLTKFLDLQSEFAITLSGSCIDKVREAANLISVTDDMNSYLAVFGTGAVKPARPRFQSQFKSAATGNSRLSSTTLNRSNSNADASLAKTSLNGNLISKSVLARSKSQLNKAELANEDVASVSESKASKSSESLNKSLAYKKLQGIGSLTKMNRSDRDLSNPAGQDRMATELAQQIKARSEHKLSIETGATRPDVKALLAEVEPKNVDTRNAEIAVHENVVKGAMKSAIDSGFPISASTNTPTSAQKQIEESATVEDIIETEKDVATENAAVAQELSNTETSEPVVIATDSSYLLVASPVQTISETESLKLPESFEQVKTDDSHRNSIVAAEANESTPIAESNQVETKTVPIEIKKPEAPSAVAEPVVESQVSSEITTVKQSRTFEPRVCSRRSIKMEGYLNVCDEQGKEWLKRWCTLEGGYIWIFDSPEDNNKPQGMNKPKSMISLAKSVAKFGYCLEGWTAPDSKDLNSQNMITLAIGAKRQILLACATEPEQAEWLQLIETLIKVKK